jgi:toxin-antitoxin system PIN domain toxin
VIVLDANLLLYAYDASSLRHAAARQWLTKAFSGQELIGLPWQTISAFLRIATDSRIYAHGMSMEEAIEHVQDWLELKNVRLLVPGDQHWRYLRRMLIDGDVRGALATDAALAAIALENGGTLYSADRDFARFPGLRWINPLAAS